MARSFTCKQPAAVMTMAARSSVMIRSSGGILHSGGVVR